ncbi:MAG: glycerol-3-phosphate 1-O-acyltransferase PlsY [Burkholderiales bacterium]
MSALASLATLVLAYLIGSISFAVIVSRVFALPDPRSYGSRNPGATNVLRSGRKAAAALTLAGDLLKGVFAVWVAKRFGPALGVGENTVPLAGLAVFLGHLYPVFFRFQGGKGVATAAGILFSLSLPVGLTALAAWVAVFAATRISSLGALAASIAAPFSAWYFLGWGSFTAVIAVMTALLVWRHRSNIRKLLTGAEETAM